MIGKTRIYIDEIKTDQQGFWVGAGKRNFWRSCTGCITNHNFRYCRIRGNIQEIQ